MLRRGRPLLRTAAVVGTASAVAGGVHHRQQQRWDAKEQQEYDGPAVPGPAAAAAVRPAAGPGRTRHHRGADEAGAAARAGHPHRRGVRGQEGSDPRDLRRRSPLVGRGGGTTAPPHDLRGPLGKGGEPHRPAVALDVVVPGRVDEGDEHQDRPEQREVGEEREGDAERRRSSVTGWRSGSAATWRPRSGGRRRPAHRRRRRARG